MTTLTVFAYVEIDGKRYRAKSIETQVDVIDNRKYVVTKITGLVEDDAYAQSEMLPLKQRR